MVPLSLTVCPSRHASCRACPPMAEHARGWDTGDLASAPSEAREQLEVPSSPAGSPLPMAQVLQAHPGHADQVRLAKEAEAQAQPHTAVQDHGGATRGDATV